MGGGGAPAAGEAGGDVESPGPVGDGSVLRAAEFAVAEEGDAGALVGEAILVGVGGHGGHAGDGEVERRDLEAQVAHEGQHEGAKAGVDVEADAEAGGRARDTGDVVDDTVGERRCGRDDERGAGGEAGDDGRGRQLEGLLVDGHDDEPAGGVHR